jgi:hypothetical protein
VNDIGQDLVRGRADATLLIGLVFAIGVTIHILLSKREVASAVGWIGLVWFAPILGAITYLLFGVNRVRRRARQLRPSQDDPTNPSVQFRPTARPAWIHWDAASAGSLRVRFWREPDWQSTRMETRPIRRCWQP